MRSPYVRRQALRARFWAQLQPAPAPDWPGKAAWGTRRRSRAAAAVAEQAQGRAPPASSGRPSQSTCGSRTSPCALGSRCALPRIHIHVAVILVQRKHLPGSHGDAGILGSSRRRRGAAAALLRRLLDARRRAVQPARRAGQAPGRAARDGAQRWQPRAGRPRDHGERLVTKFALGCVRRRAVRRSRLSPSPACPASPLTPASCATGGTAPPACRRRRGGARCRRRAAAGPAGRPPAPDPLPAPARKQQGRGGSTVPNAATAAGSSSSGAREQEGRRPAPRRRPHLRCDVAPEALHAGDPLGPAQEVGGHAVQQACVPRARRQAHVQLVQVVLALLRSGALQGGGGHRRRGMGVGWSRRMGMWGGPGSGPSGRLPAGRQTGTTEYHSRRGRQPEVQRSQAPAHAFGPPAGGSNGFRGRRALTAPALPGRASPTCETVMQGGLNDISMGYGSQLPPSRRLAWNLTASGTCPGGGGMGGGRLVARGGA